MPPAPLQLFGPPGQFGNLRFCLLLIVRARRGISWRQRHRKLMQVAQPGFIKPHRALRGSLIEAQGCPDAVHQSRLQIAAERRQVDLARLIRGAQDFALQIVAGEDQEITRVWRIFRLEIVGIHVVGEKEGVWKPWAQHFEQSEFVIHLRPDDADGLDPP